MKINEIFPSIQGESSYAGFPCTFIRTAECNLRCKGCDTTYAYEKGTEMSLTEIMKEVATNLVEITGGECLLQKEEVIRLTDCLADRGHRVLIETNGSVNIQGTERAIRILDVKCPSTEQSGSFDLDNIKELCPTDQVKFVIFEKEDLYFAQNFIREHRLSDKVSNILFSLARGDAAFITGHSIAEFILTEKIPGVRLQVQLHKIIDMP